MPPATVSLRVERQLLAGGALLVCGVDEVGRGALGGPVSVGMVVVDATVRRSLPGVRDSKLLTPTGQDRARAAHPALGGGVRGRARLGRRDRRCGDHRGAATGGDAGAGGAAGRAGCRPPRRQARLAHAAAAGPPLRRARGRGPCHPSRCGSRPTSPAPRWPRPACWPRSSGTRSWPISGTCHPRYGWAGNKGYASPDHLAALQEHGPCEEHRRSWRLPGPVSVEAAASRIDGETAASDGVICAAFTGESGPSMTGEPRCGRR